MSTNKYNYLKKFVDVQGRAVYVNKENDFITVLPSELQAAEERLGFQFPEQLKEFYNEIGFGHLTVPHNAPEDYKCYHTNKILHPNHIADILILGEDSGLVTYEVEFQEHEMPFFDVADSADFLVMHPHSKNPNAVYDQLGNLIENNFSDFIYNLYYKSPTYYFED